MLVCIVLLAGIGPAGAVEPSSADAGPGWPLDLPTRYLTSNFMEYRSGRFHAGLDFKTQSKSGFAARAVEDGSVVRVRAMSSAYGRAVYLLGESGRTYVYAHLSRFNDPLRTLVRAAQEESGTYRTGLYFAPGKIEVRRGEVLGLTGESGTGGPHLHFEVRDPDNGPVNPLARGFAVPDTFAPVIHAVRAVPAAAASRINGGGIATLLKAEDGNGLSGVQEPLVISGPVAFAASIIDAADIRGHRLEPWVIEVHLDGSLVYSCRNDRYDFSENSLQRLEWLEVPGIRDRWLHQRPGNTLTGRQGGEWHLGPGGNGLAAGDHELVVRAADFAGNETSVTLPLKVVADAAGLPAATGPWVEDPVAVSVDSLAGKDLRPLVDNGDELRDFAVLQVFDPAEGDPVLARTRLAIVPVELDSSQSAAARGQGLVPAGPAVDYLAADWPIDAALAVSLPGPLTVPGDTLGPESDPAVGVYRWSRDRWRSVGPVMEPESATGFHRFALSSPGRHAVFRDVAGPVIHPSGEVVTVAADPRGASFGVTLPRWAIFPVALDDLGAGIAPESLESLLDGRPIVVEPDLPRDRILVELPDDLPPGRHVLHLKVRDEAANGASAEVLIDCRE